MNSEAARPLVVVQNNYIVKNTARVAVYARERGIDLLDISLTDDMDFDAAGFDLARCGKTLVYGSVGFLKRAAAHPVLRRDLAWSEGGFLASTWAKAFGVRYVGAGGALMPAAEVSARLAAGENLAVRPEDGMKGFQGGVYTRAKWGALGVADDTMCFAVTPSVISSECRVWFAGGEPAMATRYMLEGKLRKDSETVPDAVAAAAEIAAIHLPFSDVVMDVGLTPDGWRLIEFNCIHSSGWYDMDPAAVLDRMLGGRIPVDEPRPVGP